MATTNLTVPIIINWKDIEEYMAQHNIVEVVRCENCKWRNKTGRCTYIAQIYPFVAKDHFCKYGESKE